MSGAQWMTGSGKYEGRDGSASAEDRRRRANGEAKAEFGRKPQAVG